MLMFAADLAVREELDKEKQQACLSHHIILIPVPFWWDGKEDSLLKIVQQALVFNAKFLPAASEELLGVKKLFHIVK